ncbi:MAG: phospho-N-acetylmuramoyl-pentapeptide-transferase [Prevotellaceae bacterium]|jgi:phospho-N-acetylmuramoyl-pentapeptide-transferase|nr:phospho-N-acetylmuramoyl-pentapeptide-transferase [Prevotellaceae bacterium]
MLYHLFKYLREAFETPGAGLFTYISFRASMAMIFALIIGLIIGKRIIRMLQRKQIGEEIRDLGLEGQMQKKGTPTMGGIIILLAILVPILLFGNLKNVYVILMIVSTIWLGLIGFLDDYIKVFKKNKDGLKGKFKIIGQVGLGLIVGLTLYFSDSVVVRERVSKPTPTSKLMIVGGEHAQRIWLEEGKSTKTTIPFFKNNEFDYAMLSPVQGEHKQDWGWLIFIIATIFIIVAVSNGANLTDGMDGLATGISAIIGTTLGIFAYLSGNVIYADYLNIMYIPNSGELVVYIAAFIGALIGFLWYNSYPAQVFMGDTGSLALGGIIAVFAIIIRKELLIPILCGIFFVESISVVLQVGYFKYTKKRYGTGRRIFKMTPLHHHYQKQGNAGIDAIIQRPLQALPESKIVICFWIIAFLLAVISIVTLKIR